MDAHASTCAGNAIGSLIGLSATLTHDPSTPIRRGSIRSPDSGEHNERAHHPRRGADHHRAVLAPEYRREPHRRQHVDVRLLAVIHLEITVRIDTENHNKISRDQEIAPRRSHMPAE